MDTEVS